MGEGECMKFCVESVGFPCENEGNVRPLGEKDCALLNAERIVYISLVIITVNFCVYVVSVSFMLV